MFGTSKLQGHWAREQVGSSHAAAAGRTGLLAPRVTRRVATNLDRDLKWLLLGASLVAQWRPSIAHGRAGFGVSSPSHGVPGVVPG